MPGRGPRLRTFLFPPDSGHWLSLLRIGLGLQVMLYTWSLRADWDYLFGLNGHGLVNRTLNEAILSAQSHLVPRLGWCIAAGRNLGLSEAQTLSLVWWSLLGAGLLLLLGLGARAAAIAAWFLYLSSAKSGTLFAYGVDNFTVIGLFYLAIAPFPDPWSLDRRIRKKALQSPERLGFHRRILQLHLCLIYFFGGLAKSTGPDWWNGNSLWLALTRPPFDLISPQLLIHFAPLLTAGGICVWLLEMSYPVLIWPVRTRRIWLGGILLLHLSIGLTMGLYLFAFVMVVLNLAAFAPEIFLGWEKAVRARAKRSDSSPGQAADSEELE